MVWHVPHDWTVDELVKADYLNEISDNLAVLKTSISDAGKIVAISSTYFDSLDGSALTGVAKLASGNAFSAGVQNFNGGATTRLIAPAGADKWAT